MPPRLQENPTVAIVAGDVMRRDVPLVDAGTLITAAWERMRTRNVDYAVAVQDGVCLGIVTLQDLFTAWSLELMPDSRRTVLTLVTPATCVDEHTPAPQLCELLLRARHGAALVTDDDGTMLGVITYADVLARLTQPVTGLC